MTGEPATPVTRVVFTGSRSWTDDRAVAARVAKLDPATEVVVGDARGADASVRYWALRLGHRVRIMRADWDQHGRSAGPIRNRAMLDLNPALVVAFRAQGRSRGTDDCVEEARRRGIEVEEHRA